MRWGPLAVGLPFALRAALAQSYPHRVAKAAQASYARKATILLSARLRHPPPHEESLQRFQNKLCVEDAREAQTTAHQYGQTAQDVFVMADQATIAHPHQNVFCQVPGVPWRQITRPRIVEGGENAHRSGAVGAATWGKAPEDGSL